MRQPGARDARTIAPVALAALLASGCSGTPGISTTYQADPSRSFALNVATAAGLKGLEDDQALTTETASGSGLATRALVGAGYLGTTIYQPPPGFSPVGAGALALLTVLTTGPSAPRHATYNLVLAWMPKEEAPSDVTAAARIEELLFAAFENASKIIDLGHPIKPTKREIRSDKLPGQAMIADSAFSIEDEACDDVEVLCRYIFRMSYTPKQGKQPSFLGQGDSWIIDADTPKSISASRIVPSREGPKPALAYDDLGFLTEVTRHLPPWMFIYLVPGVYGTRAADGTIVPGARPVILNAGSVHLFASPG